VRRTRRETRDGAAMRGMGGGGSCRCNGDNGEECSGHGDGGGRVGRRGR
jgi:hypothetical protein